LARALDLRGAELQIQPPALPGGDRTLSLVGWSKPRDVLNDTQHQLENNEVEVGGAAAEGVVVVVFLIII